MHKAKVQGVPSEGTLNVTGIPPDVSQQLVSTRSLVKHVGAPGQATVYWHAEVTLSLTGLDGMAFDLIAS